MQTRPSVIVPVRRREDFLDQAFTSGDLSGMFVPGSFEVNVGDDVDLEVVFVEEHVKFRIRGTVVWRRAKSGGSLRPGLGVEFAPDDENAANLLVQYASGRDVHLVERDGRRFGCGIKVKVKSGGVTMVEETDDISEGGAFILTDDPIPVGTAFELKLQPPGSLFGVGVKAVVAWRREQGRRGIGVEFVFDSPRKREQIAKLVRQMKDRILKELHARAGGGRSFGQSLPPQAAGTSADDD